MPNFFDSPFSTGDADPAGGTAATRVGLAQRSIVTCDDYASARRIIAQLGDTGFPVERAAVIGTDLHRVERNRGRLSTADVTGRGALSGLLIGAAVGWLLRLVGVTDSSMYTGWLILNAAVLGGVLGAAVALLGYVITQGKRSFLPDEGVLAGHYDVMVDADLADRAIRLHDNPVPDGSAEAPSPATGPATKAQG